MVVRRARPAVLSVKPVVAAFPEPICAQAEPEAADVVARNACRAGSPVKLTYEAIALNIPGSWVATAQQ